MLLPNRHGSVDSYRYAFNTMEKDDEIFGEGNNLNADFRKYNPRVGTWFSIDSISFFKKRTV